MLTVCEPEFPPENVGELYVTPFILRSPILSILKNEENVLRAKVLYDPGTAGWQFYLTFKSLSCLEISSFKLVMHTVKYRHHSFSMF